MEHSPPSGGLPDLQDDRETSGNRPLQLFLLTDEVETDRLSAALVVRWGSGEVPNLFDFEHLVVEIPAAKDPLIEEVLQANRGGTSVVWLFGKRSSPDLLARIVGSPVFRMRNEAPGSRWSIADTTWTFYFHSVDGYWATWAAEGSWQALARNAAGGLAIAAGLPQDSGGEITVLPFPQKSPEIGLGLLIRGAVESAEHVEAEAADPPASEVELSREERSFLRFAGMLLAVLIVLTVARSNQRQINLRLLDNNPWFDEASNSVSETLLARRVLKVDPTDWKTVAEGNLPEGWSRLDAVDLLSLLADLELHGRERQLLRHLVSRSEEVAWSVDAVVEHLEEDLLPSIRWALEDERYLEASRCAELFLEIAYSLPPCEYLERGNLDLNFAQQVLDLAHANFPFADANLVTDLVQVMTEYEMDMGTGRFAETWEPQPPTDPSLIDNLSYSMATIEAGAASADHVATPWERFRDSYPKSEKAEEALFNILQGHRRLALGLDSKPLRRLVRRQVREEAHERVLQDARDFVAGYPDSYLADDALFYKLTHSDAIGFEAGVFDAFTELMEAYGSSDRAKVVSYRMARQAERSGESLVTDPEAVVDELIRNWALVEPEEKATVAIGFLAGSHGSEPGVERFFVRLAGAEGEADLRDMTVRELVTVMVRRAMK